ncbi:MAG: sugar transferase [Actinobacteria bacterium]|nr:sugar transferase [Actinomycetota bacterium]
MNVLHLAERRLILLVGDVTCGLVSLLGVTWFAGIWGNPDNLPVAVWCLTLVAIDATILRASDALDPRQASNPFSGGFGGGRAWLLSALAYLAVPYLSAPLLASRYVVLQFVLSGLLLRVAWRILHAVLMRQVRLTTRYVIAGCGPAASGIAEVIACDLGPDHVVLGCVDDTGPASTEPAGRAVLRHLGDFGTLESLIAERRFNTLILATAGQMPARLQRQVIEAYERGIRVVPMPALYESVTGRVLAEYARDFWATTLPHLDQDWAYRLASRAADIVAGITGLLVTVCLIPPVFVAMRLAGPGPLFYRQVRLGKNGAPFIIWKFRSMVPDAEAVGGAQWSHSGDMRVTGVGRWLRRIRIDEFPQFWNILRGEMALVGPRPERPELVEDLEEAIPFYRIRLAVRPGLTGWAQVKASYASSAADTVVKFQYDLYYLRNRSVYLDLLIVLKTVVVVLGLRGT